MRKARITVIVLLILLGSLVHWPKAKAIVPQDQTISITDTHDDRFITEAGIGIDSYLCHILDPNMDIRSYLVFRELEINYWEPLTNATIRLRTTVNLDFDNESSVTIYGMRFSDLQDEGVISPSFVLSVPLTSSYVNVNTSQFYGQQWHEVNVTSIVEELIRSIHWDGHGVSGTDIGDDIGFVIVGAEGHDTRWFIDYYYGTPSLAPQLVIHWNHEPQPPSGYEDYVYNRTYGDFDIWYGNITGWLDYESFTEIDTGSHFTVENSTYVYTTSNVDSNDNVKLVKADNSTSFDIKFGINVTYFDDDSLGTQRYWIFIYGGRESVGYAIGTWECDFWFICFISDENDDKIIPQFYCYDQTDGYLDNGLEYEIPWMRWNHLTFDMATKQYSWKMYNDSAMTILDAEISGTHTRPNLDTSNHIYALNTYNYDYPTPDIGQFKLYSRVNLGNYIITLNDTVIMDNDDPLTFNSTDEAEDWIESYDPDPEDPDPGDEWFTGPGGETGAFTRFRMRLWFMLIGFGCLFGPVLFFAWRRPSGYYILCGAIVMLIGIGLLLSIGQV